jgi:predicted nucleic acid-binding protein
MKFWDSSALIQLFVEQDHSEILRKIAKEDPDIVVWWGTIIECKSAIARLRRECIVTVDEEEEIRSKLKTASSCWIEIMPGEQVRQVASRLLINHPLRTADSLQLAAAITWAGAPVQEDCFVCLDSKLREAARKEGFFLLP